MTITIVLGTDIIKASLMYHAFHGQFVEITYRDLWELGKINM